MLNLKTATLAIALAAAAPLAFAQDADTTTASGKRVSIVGGVTQLEPTKNAWAGDTQRIKAHGDVAPTLGVTYHINDNIGVEAWGAVDKYGHRITGNDGQGKLGSVSSQPYAVSGQYQFGAADQTIRPFVGLGYYEQNFNEEEAESSGALAGSRIAVETAKGAMATVGVDANINERWFARADARYLHDTNDAKVRVDGQDVADANFAPIMVGVGVGMKF
jgi:outer membrane protein